MATGVAVLASESRFARVVVTRDDNAGGTGVTSKADGLLTNRSHVVTSSVQLTATQTIANMVNLANYIVLTSRGKLLKVFLELEQSLTFYSNAQNDPPLAQHVIAISQATTLGASSIPGFVPGYAAMWYNHATLSPSVVPGVTKKTFQPIIVPPGKNLIIQSKYTTAGSGNYSSNGGFAWRMVINEVLDAAVGVG